jgi:hypothetical protein
MKVEKRDKEGHRTRTEQQSERILSIIIRLCKLTFYNDTKGVERTLCINRNSNTKSCLIRDCNIVLAIIISEARRVVTELLALIEKFREGRDLVCKARPVRDHKLNSEWTVVIERRRG